MPRADSETAQEIIRKKLMQRGLDWTVHFYPILDSTQDQAQTLARAGAPHGSLIVAGEQRAGRGRHQRRWWHDAQNGLAFSLIVRPDLPAAAATGLVFAAALALRQAVFEQGVQCRIKWPNDLVVVQGAQRRKLAGILSQASLRGEGLAYALIGVGLNVNTPGDAFAPEADEAASLLSVTGKKHNKYNVLNEFCQNFSRWLRVLEGQGFAALLPALRQHSATLGQALRVQLDGDMHEVMAEDFDDSGALIVRLRSGEQRRVLDPVE